MIWRLLICFSLCGCLGSAAQVRGQISIMDTSHGAAKSINPGGTVVWLDNASGDANESGEARREPSSFTMLQKNKSFSPHVLAIPVGSTVDFPNGDPIFHNAFSNYNGQIFDIGLYPPGTSRSVKFSRAGIVRIFCNIHATMSAVIVALKSPFFATTAADGTFTIDGVPDGTYNLCIYSEHATEKTLSRLTRKVEVTGESKDLGTISLEGSAYLNIPHLNKYGKEYPPAPDSSLYPGARQ